MFKYLIENMSNIFWENKCEKYKSHNFKFKQKYSFKEREELSKLTQNRIPVLIEYVLPDIDISNNSRYNYIKYAINPNMTIGKFIINFKKEYNIYSLQPIITIIGNTIPDISDTFEKIYRKFADDDGFLYILLVK